MPWLQDYLAYTEEQESPESFHLWAAIAVLGHVLGRRVWLDRHFFKIYPGQIMVLLVSESALVKKSTTLNLAVEFLSYLPREQVNRLPSKLSPPILVEALKRLDRNAEPIVPSVGLIVASELGVFFTRESFAEVLATMINDLNDASMVPFKYETKSGGEILVDEPCVGMIAGTTPTGLAHELPKAAQTAGFFGRLLIVYDNEIKHPNDLVDPPANLKALQARLVRDLFRIAEMRGPFTFHPEARLWFKEWYRRYVEVAQKMKLLASTTGYYGRRSEHLLRVAMVVSAAQSSERVLTVPVLEAALKLLEGIEANMPLAAKELGVKPLTADQDRLLQVLETQPLGEGALYKKVWRYFDGVQEYRRCIQSLIASDLIAARDGLLTLNLERGTMLGQVATREDEGELAETRAAEPTHALGKRLA